MDEADLTELSDLCPSFNEVDVVNSPLCNDPENDDPPNQEELNWMCPASLSIHGDMELWNDGSQMWDYEYTTWEASVRPVCIGAPDISTAKKNCEGHCNIVDDFYEAQESPIRRWDASNEFDCSLHASSTPITTTNPINDCLAGGVMPHAFVPYNFTGTMLIGLSTGESALISPIQGAVNYVISDCARGLCDLTLTSIEVFSHPASGFYMDAAGGSGSYTYSNIGITLAEPVGAALDQARGTVTFREHANIVMDVDDITLDGAFLGPIDDQYTSQVVGSLRDDRLSLNIIHQTPSLTLYILLHVTPR
ncbi:MAG TPA: hypothetical protein ENJ18_17670 [Nannocystis exedens]|nr:hypothetical protein [Nannocystis exedens]